MKEIDIFKKVGGSFAENKDIARDIRLGELLPALNIGEEVVINFEGIESATQSFIHALISDVIRKKGVGVLDKIYFQHCNPTVKKIINIVIEYMQDTN
ncbi:MAG: STAS-like domain-containing protein [Candidatus Aenigmarchaeota archaeon]|nr:STAS-like domain-containing protein [Candidatus Aenigmarchaeota archaeon]